MNVEKQFSLKPIVVAISIAALSSAAYAAEFSDLDVDVDGNLTQGEMQEYKGLVDHWADVDTDGDGMISETEFSMFVKDPTLTERTGWESAGGEPGAARPALSAEIGEEFDNLDVDRDGSLSKAELESNADAMQYWANYDVDRDDYMNRDEYINMRDFNTLDTDRDGNLSQTEMQRHPGVVEYWSDVDTDRDEYINREEFASMTTDETLAEKTGWQSGGGEPGAATPAQN